MPRRVAEPAVAGGPRDDGDAVATAAWRAGLGGRGGALSSVLRDAADARDPVPAVVGTAIDGEPLSATRAAIVLARAGAVVAGLRAAGRATGAPVLFVLPATPIGAALRRALQAALATTVGDLSIELHEVVPFQGCDDPLVLCDALGFALPHVPLAPGEVRWHGGAGPSRAPLVLGADLLAALGDAVSGAPLLRRLVSVAGVVERPGVYDVPLGTSLDWLAEAAGGSIGSALLFQGGAAPGRRAGAGAALDADTRSLLVLHPEHPAVGRASAFGPAELDRDLARLRAACSGCRRCTDLCPRALVGLPIAPHLLRGAEHCSGCGACEIVCPAGLRPAALLRDPRATTVTLFGRARTDAPARAPDPTRTHRRIPLETVVARLDLAGLVPPDPRPVPFRVRPPGVRLALGAGLVPRIAIGGTRAVEAGEIVADAAPGSRGVPLHAPLAGEVKWHDDDPHVLRIRAS